MKEIYTNREISWLHFNERVLQEAIHPATPLIERARFLGIYSNNRDEFFRVRVATLRRMLKYEKDNHIEGKDTKKVLDEITKIVNEQEVIFTKAFEQLNEDLKEHDIHILKEDELNEAQGKFVLDYFSKHVRSFLFPLMLKNLRNIGGLKDDLLYLAVCLKNGKEEETDYALVQVPIGKVPRLIQLPDQDGKTYLIFLDDVIRYCLHEVFDIFGYKEYAAYTIKFTRDAELDIDNDVSKSFLEKMSVSIKQRKKGEPVRFIYDEKVPLGLLNVLLKKFKVSLKRDNVRAGGRYHNMKDLMAFPRVGPAELHYPPTPPLPHPELSSKKSILEAIRERDIMLHYPYQSFQYIVDLLREASLDPQVRAIKMTFYRVAHDSKVMNALINAARNGKQVTVFMELQARFDEESNIYWTNRLQEEGAKVIQTIPGYKVHSKLILIRRKEDEKNIYYANISTGNYNESTAKVYADDSLLTANQDIAREVNEVFHLFESQFYVPKFEHLIIAPFRIRDFFIEMLENEIKLAKQGKEAWVVLKLNSLVDKKIIRKLYEASQAGVKMKLIVRAICVLKPGVKGLSENIEAISIVDKFLEHSRVLVFNNGGDVKYFTGSSDWMQRNFDHRVEVITPIFDKRIQKELWDILRIQLKDNVKARCLEPARLNKYCEDNNQKKYRAQFDTYEYLKKKLKS